MKRIFTFILIAFISIGFLAPLGMELYSGNITIHKNIANAKDDKDVYDKAQKDYLTAKDEFNKATTDAEIKAAEKKMQDAQKIMESTDYFKENVNTGGNIDTPVAGVDGCTIKSAVFNPSGKQPNTYYKLRAEGRPPLDIVIKTKGCLQQALNLTVFEDDACPIVNCDDALNSSYLLRHPFKVLNDNFTIHLLAGEEECERAWSGALFGYDCDLFFYIREDNSGDHVLYNSWHETGGQIKYNCDGFCRTDAKWLSIESNGDDDHPVNVDGVPEEDRTDFNSIYTLLAPIGNLTCVSPDGVDKNGVADKCVKGGIGDYLGTMFLIIIGLCGALAVIMIVIGGVQYMGTESVFGKTEAKGKILSAILGLLIALGAYAILQTINPDLTGENGVKVDQVTVDTTLEYPEISSTEYQNITGQPVLPKSQYVALAQKVAKEVGVDECLVIATVGAESAWRPNSMGSDANFALDIKSRRAFVNSGKKYSGASFSAGDKSLITNKSFKDDFVVDRVKVGLGMDWRFSAGFGILGINFFPAGYFNKGFESSPLPLSKKDDVPAIDPKYPLNPKTGKTYTPIEVMVPENSLRLGALVLKNKVNACHDPYLALRAFNTGSCTKTAFNEAYRISEYKKCKGIK